MINGTSFPAPSVPVEDASSRLGRVVADFTAPPAPGPDAIAGRFVTLERLDPDRHAADLFDANLGRGEVWDYLGYGPFAALDDYRAWQAAMAASADPLFYALRDTATGKVGGVASFLRIDRANGVIEIGHIQIAPVLQRTSASSEAIMLMIRWAFDAGYRRVEWKCNDLNAPSMRAADRFGFTLADRMHYGSAGLDYVTNLAGPRYLSSLTHQGAPLFTEVEVDHMTDVKTVLWIATAALVVLVVVCALLIASLLRTSPGGVRRALFAGAVWLPLAVIALAVLAVLGWETFFAGFHSLFFADGTWTFSVQDALIRLYPSQFWVDAAVVVGLVTLLASLVTLVLTWPTRRRRELSADRREQLLRTRLRWAREEDAQLR